MKKKLKTFVSSITDMNLVYDRLENDFSFEQLAKKYNLNSASQARSFYQNTLAYLVHNSKKLKKSVIKELNSPERL